MKQLILAFTALIALVAISCNQNGVSPDSSAVNSESARVSSSSVTNGSSETVITASQLPAAATTYLTTNFPGYVLVRAEKETSSTGVVRYEVKFTANGTTREAYFDAAGTLIKVEAKNEGKSGSSNEVSVTASQLPAAALTYLTTTFPGYVFVKAEKETSSAGIIRYEVKITVNGAKKEIKFDANGALI